LRHKEKMRETFGRISTRASSAGLIDRQSQTAKPTASAA